MLSKYPETHFENEGKKYIDKDFDLTQCIREISINAFPCTTHQNYLVSLLSNLVFKDAKSTI